MTSPYPFTASVPLTQQQEDGLGLLPAVQSTLLHKDESGRQPTFLILEENLHIEELLSYALLTAGYRHIVTMQKMRSLRRIDQHIDLILLDLDSSLVWMNTVECLWHLILEQEKAASLQSGVRATCPARIVLTCHPQKKEMVEQSGFLALLKPFHMRDLLHAVTTALDGQTYTYFVEQKCERTMLWDSKRTEAR